MKLPKFIDRLLVSYGIKEDEQKLYLQSYHYQRAIELRNQSRDGDAFEELKTELQEHPKNGHAHLLIAEIHLDHKVLGTALQACNNALDILLDTEDKDSISRAYYTRCKTQRALGEKEKWLSDAELANEYDANNVDALGELGDYYYYSEDFTSSDAQFNRIITLQPHNPYGYMGRGRNDQARNSHEAAIKHFDRATQLDENYYAAYSFRAESLIALGKKAEAVDNIIDCIQLNSQDRKAHDLMIQLVKSDFKTLKLKLMSKAIKNPDNDEWYRTLGWACAGAGNMIDSYDAYNKAYNINFSPEIQDFKAFCLSKLGLYDLALNDINSAISKMPDNLDLVEKKANFYAELGEINSAIDEITKIMDKEPDNYKAYYNRGRFYFEKKDYEKSIDDFSTCISLKDSFALSYLFRGWALSELDQEDKAKADFEYIVEKSEILEDGDISLGLALYLIDQDDNAVNATKSLLESVNTCDWRAAGDLLMYAAAVYCRTNHQNDAIDCIQKAIDNNYIRQWYMRNGMLLSPLANNEAYQNILENLDAVITSNREKIQCQSEKSNTDSLKGVKAEIPFTREGKMCKVQCSINGLDLHFIFDTGASEVTMSSVEATFMLKNGYLNEDDLSGKQYYRTADGSVAEGVKVNLRNVVFGGVSLTNVKAGVVTNQRAPLLLGQSVMERLGRIEIDNESEKIVING